MLKNKFPANKCQSFETLYLRPILNYWCNQTGKKSKYWRNDLLWALYIAFYVFRRFGKRCSLPLSLFLLWWAKFHHNFQNKRLHLCPTKCFSLQLNHSRNPESGGILFFQNVWKKNIIRCEKSDYRYLKTNHSKNIKNWIWK